MIESNLAGPPWWLRQRNATGITYSDASLVENYANVNTPAEFYNVKAPAEISPEQFTVSKYGLVRSSMREQHMQSYENRNKVSQAYWGSNFLAMKK